MQTVQFSANIENGIVHIPKQYQEPMRENKLFYVSISEASKKGKFNPKTFFGAGNLSKLEIDKHLEKSSNKWEVG
jgi:hypothetical protein